MKARWVFRRGAHEVTTIEVVRTPATCVVSITEASGARTQERMPAVIDAVLRQADHERQLIGRGWHLASFDHVSPNHPVRPVARRPRRPRQSAAVS
jgi:hypothetical protein